MVHICRKNELFPAYGPLHEDEINMEETEAKKMASARKRLMSYKTEKLKVKPDDPIKEIPAVNSPSNAITSQKTDGKILFVPTPDEVKEHPIFSNSSALQSGNNSLKCENTTSKPVVSISLYSLDITIRTYLNVVGIIMLQERIFIYLIIFIYPSFLFNFVLIFPYLSLI